MQKKEKPFRAFKDVSDNELENAVRKMLDELNCDGSYPDVFNVYEAVRKEHEKAKSKEPRIFDRDSQGH